MPLERRPRTPDTFSRVTRRRRRNRVIIIRHNHRRRTRRSRHDVTRACIDRRGHRTVSLVDAVISRGHSQCGAARCWDRDGSRAGGNVVPGLSHSDSDRQGGCWVRDCGQGERDVGPLNDTTTSSDTDLRGRCGRRQTADLQTEVPGSRACIGSGLNGVPASRQRSPYQRIQISGPAIIIVTQSPASPHILTLAQIEIVVHR